MKKELVHIEFRNHYNPKAKFDFVRLGKVLNRTDLNHDPCQHHLVDFYIIIFIESGEGFHTVDFTDYKCSVGSILTIRKDQLHKFIKSNIDGSMLLFTDDFLEHYLEKLEAVKTLLLFNELLGKPLIQLDKSEIKEVSNLFERIQNEYFDVNDAYSLEIIRSELHILITKLYRIKANKNLVIDKKQYLNEFVDFQNSIEKNVRSTITVNDYSQMMGMSTKKLNKITKSIINKTAKEFIDEICIKQIKRLLINTNKSIKEIAFISGFKETTNFYKYFKRHTQSTPEQFRISF